MLGAIVGDIVGSRFEFNNIKTKDFKLFTDDCFFTDDTVMTCAVAKALMKSKLHDKNRMLNYKENKRLRNNTIKYMQKIGRKYPDCGYGGTFYKWLFSDDPKSYGSFGNGAAMRISPAAYLYETVSQTEQITRAVTSVTHNHPEGFKGAEAVTRCIYMARKGFKKHQIYRNIDSMYYPLNFTLDEIRPTYKFNETCQETVPQAIMAFLESKNFEDAIRNAISLGGDSDTLAAITGSIAEAYYGIPDDIREKALTYLDKPLVKIVNQFEKRYCNENSNM